MPFESGPQVAADNPCEGNCGGAIGENYGLCLRGDCFYIYCRRCWESHKREVHDVPDDMAKLMNWNMAVAGRKDARVS